MNSFKISSLLAIALAAGSAQAAIIVSYAEIPGDFNTTLQQSTVFDFDNVSAPDGDATRFTGNFEDVEWDGVGTYDQITVYSPDQYGGAGQNASRYSVQGAGGVTQSTLNLTSGVGYFGLWWSAGDDQNVLEFYSGATLVAKFTTESLLSAVTQAGGYGGNPATPFLGQNSGQPYAFVNFFGEGDTTWDRIVFSNDGGNGFESDNHTVRDLTWGGYENEEGPLPGVLVARVEGNNITVIPEPASALLGTLGMLGLLVRRRR